MVDVYDQVNVRGRARGCGVHACAGLLVACMLACQGVPATLASYPGPSQKKGEGLVYTVCACAKLPQVFMGVRITPYLTGDYICGTVRERPFYCLGVALRVRPPVVKVYILFSTAVVNARITLLCV